MPRTKRIISESGYYHVTMRGAGRRNIFEDDIDRNEFLKRLRAMAEDGIRIHAWCLMSNHVHLLVCSREQSISKPLHKLCTSYALYFNGRHAHIGPVFQGRFASFPIESEAHLLETVRYIHLNPKDMGFSDPGEYRWSSFGEYTGARDICDTSFVLKMLGDLESFLRFHDVRDRIAFVDITGYQRRLSDAEALEIGRRIFGDGFPDSLSICEVRKRDECLGRLYQMGLSTRQLERLTGIGRSVIRRACTIGHKRHSD